MPIQILKPGEATHLKALIYGSSGAGKTRLLGTALQDERTAPMILADWEAGTTSLVGADKLGVVPIHSLRDFNEFYEYLCTSEARKTYKTVAIDSLSEIHQLALVEILAREEASTQTRKSPRTPNALEQQDYGQALMQMRRLVRLMRDLPYHFLCTALAKSDIDPRVGIVWKPNFPGAFADEVAGYVDALGFLFVAERKEGNNTVPVRVLRLAQTPNVRCKIRVPIGVNPPDQLEEPTIGKLLDLQKGH